MKEKLGEPKGSGDNKSAAPVVYVINISDFGGNTLFPVLEKHPSDDSVASTQT